MNRKLTGTGFKTTATIAIALAVVAIAWASMKLVGSSSADVVLPSRVTGKRATNGHKIKVSDHDLVHCVIYAGIRAPYENEPEFQNARDRNNTLIENRELELRYDEQPRDEEDRLVAYVLLEDGRMINEILVREGLAYVRLRSNTQLFAKQLLRAQSLARRDGLGIWAHQTPSDEALYPVDPLFAEFHRPNCEVVAKLPESRRIDLHSKDEAFSEGFAPCNKCNP